MQTAVLYGTLYSFCIAIFMSLNGPAGTCILVPSASQIHVHVPPIQLVLKHCVAHIAQTI